jgi:hypothetical protein
MFCLLCLFKSNRSVSDKLSFCMGVELGLSHVLPALPVQIERISK